MRRPATFEPNTWVVFVLMEDGALEEITCYVHNDGDVHAAAIQEAKEQGFIPVDDDAVKDEMLLDRGGWTNEGPYGP